MIGKELLSLIIGEEIKYIGGVDSNRLEYRSVDNPFNSTINIDTLTRLMKEWCWVQGFQLRSSYKSIVINSESFCEVISTTNRGTDDEPMFLLVTNQGGDSEFEAVKQATEWVANEKGLL